MAGGVLKTFGVLFLVAGVLLLIAGIAAAGYGMMDQQDHERDAGPLGVGEDQERSENNEALLYGGAAAAGIGLFGVALGVIFLLAGGARERRALRMQQQVVVQTVDGPTYTAAGRPGNVSPHHANAFIAPKYTSTPTSGDPSGDRAGGDAMADRAGGAPSNTPLERAEADPTATGTTVSETDGKRKTLLAVSLVAAVLLVGVVAVALVGGPGPDGNPLLGDRSSALIRDEPFSGSTGAGFTALGNDPTGMVYERERVLPGATERLELTLDWTPGPGGPAAYDVVVAVDMDGEWVALGSKRLEPGDVFEADGGDVDGLGGRDVRLQVRPGGNGAFSAQSFDGTWSFYRR